MELEKELNIIFTIIQSIAIIVGGCWAYRTFDIEKKRENIVTLKTYLMDYHEQHNCAASQYNQDKNIAKYKLSLLGAYNQLHKKLYLSYYVSKELRNKIFNVI